MNAQEYIVHIGLTQDFEKLTPSEKAAVVQELQIHLENPNSRSLVWILIKFGLKIFPINWIPRKMLTNNFKSPFSFSKDQQATFNRSCAEAIKSELKNLENLHPSEAISKLDKLIVNEKKYDVSGRITSIELDYDTKSDRPVSELGFTTAWEVVIEGTRNFDTATRNIPKLISKHVVVNDSNPTISDLERRSLGYLMMR